MAEKPCLHCIIADAQAAWIAAGHGDAAAAIDQSADALAHLVSAVLGREKRRRLVKELLADIPRRVRTRVQERLKDGFPTEEGPIGHG